MFLRGLKDKFKYKSALKFLRQELKSPPPAPERAKGVTSIGVIVDLDSFDKAVKFNEFIDTFGLRPNSIQVIGYRSFYDTNSPYSTPVFSEKDLGWNGAIENSYAGEFLSREYDILVNYYDSDNLMLQLMSIKTRARLRVGLTGVDQNINDLIIDLPLGEFGTFKRELHKYLKVLKELA